MSPCDEGKAASWIFFFFANATAAVFAGKGQKTLHFHGDLGPRLPSPHAVRARAEAANFPASEGQVREGRGGG